ncbi:hypothetical protein H1C71_023138 [Ictidomys tridecemlineatus]|nr:hypothetical protein H1C71_023138 [Ictidomys tridecemlineatus]
MSLWACRANVTGLSRVVVVSDGRTHTPACWLMVVASDCMNLILQEASPGMSLWQSRGQGGVRGLEAPLRTRLTMNKHTAISAAFLSSLAEDPTWGLMHARQALCH